MNVLQVPASLLADTSPMAINGRGVATPRDPSASPPRPFRRLTSAPRPQGRTTELAAPVGSSSSVVEEYFECYVEAIDELELRLRTTSSKGEEALATMAIANIPMSERAHLEVGAPLRIAIFRNTEGKQVRREQQVRVLRPSQWKVPLSDAARDELTAYYERRLRGLLRPGE